MAFTVVTSDARLTKEFGVDPATGKPVQLAGAPLSSGMAKRIALAGTPSEIARQFATVLRGLDSKQAIIPAPPPAGRDEWKLATKSDAAGRSDTIARTSQYFQAPAGPALLALDFDVKDYPDPIKQRLQTGSPTPLLDALAVAFPGFSGAASVLRPSVSAGIRNRATRKIIDSLAGQHRYYLALAGDDPDFPSRLADRLVLAGWGWGWVSKAGHIFTRTLFDVAASQDPSRLFYEADAVLSAPALEYIAGIREPLVTEGGFLDTRSCPSLSDEERGELVEIEKRIRQDRAAEAKAARDKWAAQRLPELIRRGTSPAAAERIVSSAADRQTLEGDFLVTLDDGSTVTVREILADRTTFHKKTCADPLEPEYRGGQNIAVIYTDGLPHIWSHAHGSIDYRLEHSPSDWFEQIEDGPEDWPEPVDIFGDGDTGALMDVPPNALPAVVDRYSRDVAERMGVPVIFAAIGAIVAASGAIGGATRLQPKARDSGWTTPAFLWAFIVEEPGGRKSPIMDEMVGPLNRLDDRRAGEDVPKRNEWELLKSRAARTKGAPALGPRPRLRRSMADSFTIEALRGVLEENPKGVLVVADEITGLIGGLDQYKSKGGSDRADL